MLYCCIISVHVHSFLLCLTVYGLSITLDCYHIYFFKQIIIYKSADSNNNRNASVYVDILYTLYNVYVYEIYFFISFGIIPSRNVLYFECVSAHSFKMFLFFILSFFLWPFRQAHSLSLTTIVCIIMCQWRTA